MRLAMTIKRVTTTFLVKGRARQRHNINHKQHNDDDDEAFRSNPASPSARDELRIAIFHRCATMPTFPNRYAACSGSMEVGETPWETAQRELSEETNVDYMTTAAEEASSILETESGLYVDVDFVSPRSGRTSIIRVYPFVVHVASNLEVSMRGTEHDSLQWMTLKEMEDLDQQAKTVPSLALAFHHATAGRYDTSVTEGERQWASDKKNGATTMTRNALQLLTESTAADPARISMLRPSMVTIVNCMNAVQKVTRGAADSPQSTETMSRQAAVQQVQQTLKQACERSTSLAVDTILQLYQDNQLQPLSIGTFSRSSTLAAILNQLLDEHPHVLQTPILCSRSSPGEEGEFMALDLSGGKEEQEDSKKAICVDDEDFKKRLNDLDIFLIGADCILADQSAIVNKVGTADLASTIFAKSNKNSSHSLKKCQVLCCTDRFKVWEDAFPPPLEEELFEVIPVANHIDRILLPPNEISYE